MQVRIYLLLTMAFVAIPLALSQESDSKREESNPPASQQDKSKKPAPQRPTLGPATPPSLGGGSKTSSTTDRRRLLRVKKIYVERMDNNLHEKLIAALAKTKRFQLVGDYKEADAVMRGTCLDMRRLKLLRSEVYLNEVHGASIWQDNVRRPINPPAVKAAVAETADIIAAHLGESLIEAERQ
jgi:hypothetical protein